LTDGLLNALESGAAKIQTIWSEQEARVGTIANAYAAEFEREKLMLSQYAQEIQKLLAAYPQAGAALTKSAKELFDAVSQTTHGVTSIASDLGRISTDVKAIDKIIDDVVRLMRERLTALSAHP
jgi:methyl-accepting chemotaxis protein